MQMGNEITRIPCYIDRDYDNEFVEYSDGDHERVCTGTPISVFVSDGDRCYPQLVRIDGAINTVTYDAHGNLAGMTIVDADGDVHFIPGTQEIFHCEVYQ